MKKTVQFLLITLLVTGCSGVSQRTFQPSSFAALSGWSNTKAEGLKTSLMHSCDVYKKRTGPVSDKVLFGTYEQWHPLCDQLESIGSDQLAFFFQQNFDVYQVAPEEEALFTGYYSPLLNGSRTPSERYSIPLMDKPDDLVMFNPADFGMEEDVVLKGKMNKGWLIPYDDRENINRRFSNGDYRKEVTLWVDDIVDRFFLQIQGSGFVQFENGELVYVRISGRNGHPYFAIGRYLKREGLLDVVTMQSIRQWLAENPDRLEEVLYQNRDFIFFSEMPEGGPIGAQGVLLTPDHSAAVDSSVIPLGTPLWLETTLNTDDSHWAHAMTAQDVGSAIKGRARADIFFGAGEQAAEKAGHQNAGGKLYVLVPRSLAKAQ